MFTGIVQAVGTVEHWDGARLVVDGGNLATDDLKLGESIAVNGCCLTLVEGPKLSFDLSEETVQKSTFSTLTTGKLVNLERAMRPLDRLGGHIVQGHVDGVGKIVSITPTDQATVYRFSVTVGTYLIEKGSITIDGISLTVVNPSDNEFDVWVIPHTLKNTNLRSLSQSSFVNVEFDLIAKYVEKLRIPYL